MEKQIEKYERDY